MEQAQGFGPFWFGKQQYSASNHYIAWFPQQHEVVHLLTPSSEAFAVMASADTLRILRELQSRPDNKVSMRFAHFTAVRRHRSSCRPTASRRAQHRSRCAGLRGLQRQEPPMGDRLIRDLHVPGVQRQTPRAGRTHLLRQVPARNASPDQVGGLLVVRGGDCPQVIPHSASLIRCAMLHRAGP